MTTPAAQSATGLPPESGGLVAELYERSGSRKFGFSLQQFSSVLKEIAAKYLPAEAGEAECGDLYRSLRIEDLVLARACAAGSEPAWDAFMLRFRGKLYDIAAYITRESSAARELADSIYADLYGTEMRDGRRHGKLASYTGRGSLEGWLRTVIAQEFVNRYRRQRRLVSLEEREDEKEGDAGRLPSPHSEPLVVVDPRVETATDQALAALSGEERFLLAAYYLDGRTLAEISRLLAVHESTISRKLERTAKLVRKRIMATLLKKGMSRRQAEEALQIDVRDLQVNLRSHLAQKVEPQAFSKKEPEAQAEGAAGIVE